MTGLTAHLETSFSAHVNPVKHETVEVDGFVSVLTTVSLWHLQVEQGVIRVQQPIVQRLFSPRESSAQILQSFTPAQTNPFPTCLLCSNPSQYNIQLSLETFSINDDGQEMMVVNSNKSAPCVTLFRLLCEIKFRDDNVLLSYAIISVSWVHFKARGTGDKAILYLVSVLTVSTLISMSPDGIFNYLSILLDTKHFWFDNKW